MGRRRRKLQPIGGFKRTAVLAAVGVLALALGAACFLLSLLVRPSSSSGSVTRASMLLDPNNLDTSRTEGDLTVNPSARYDLYLTVPVADVENGDYCSIDVEAHRNAESRYLTYSYTNFGTDVVRRKRMGRDATETYEMDRNVHVSSVPETIRVVFNPTSAWFRGMSPVQVEIDVVEVTPADRLLLVVTSVLQVATFPAALVGVLLLWLALMRQMRLIGVQVVTPGRFRPLRSKMKRAPAEGGDS